MQKIFSEKYLEEELNFLIDMFVEKVHDWNYLNFIVKESKHQAPKTENTSSNYHGYYL